jgi:hypothetical protein
MSTTINNTANTPLFPVNYDLVLHIYGHIKHSGTKYAYLDWEGVCACWNCNRDAKADVNEFLGKSNNISKYGWLLPPSKKARCL